MKTILAFVALVAALGTTGCGSTADKCGPVACPNDSGLNYELCTDLKGNAIYTAGSMSCNCSTSSMGGCASCEQVVDAYCDGNPDLSVADDQSPTLDMSPDMSMSIDDFSSHLPGD